MKQIFISLILLFVIQIAYGQSTQVERFEYKITPQSPVVPCQRNSQVQIKETSYLKITDSECYFVIPSLVDKSIVEKYVKNVRFNLTPNFYDIISEYLISEGVNKEDTGRLVIKLAHSKDCIFEIYEIYTIGVFEKKNFPKEEIKENVGVSLDEFEKCSFFKEDSKLVATLLFNFE